MVLFSKYPDIMKDFLNFFRKTQKNHQKFVLLKLCNTLGATDSFECVFKHCSLLSETSIKITFFFLINHQAYFFQWANTSVVHLKREVKYLGRKEKKRKGLGKVQTLKISQVLL